MAFKDLTKNLRYTPALIYCEGCHHFEPSIDTVEIDSFDDEDSYDLHILECKHAKACTYVFYANKEDNNV